MFVIFSFSFFLGEWEKKDEENSFYFLLFFRVGRKKREKKRKKIPEPREMVRGKRKLINAFRCYGGRIHHPIGVYICPFIFGFVIAKCQHPFHLKGYLKTLAKHFNRICNIKISAQRSAGFSLRGQRNTPLSNLL